MKEDFFDTDPEPEDALHPHTTQAESEMTETEVTEIPSPSPEKATRHKWQFMGYDLSTLLIAGTAISILLLYAVWPDSQPSPSFVPDNTVQSAPALSDTPASPDILSTSEEQRYPDNHHMTTEIADTTPPAVTEKEADEIRQLGMANQEAITKLTDRLNNIEQQLTLLKVQQPPPPCPAAVRTVSPPVKPGNKTPPPRIKRPVQNTVVTRSVTDTKNWHVHTLYPGMAWITHDGSTWSVRPGDVLQGLTIHRIDTEHRVVVTDKGIIRQEN